MASNYVVSCCIVTNSKIFRVLQNGLAYSVSFEVANKANNLKLISLLCLSSLIIFLVVRSTYLTSFLLNLQNFSVIIYILDRFSPYSYQNNKKLYQDETEKRVFDLRESFWFSIISLVPQVCVDFPSSVNLGFFSKIRANEYKLEINELICYIEKLFCLRM